MLKGTTTLRRVFNSERLDYREWLFLPENEAWSLDTAAITAQLEEVPPEEEDVPKAGYPKLVLELGYVEALDCGTVMGIVENARSQAPAIDEAGLLQAFFYYYDNDAYMEIESSEE